MLQSTLLGKFHLVNVERTHRLATEHVRQGEIKKDRMERVLGERKQGLAANREAEPLIRKVVCYQSGKW